MRQVDVCVYLDEGRSFAGMYAVVVAVVVSTHGADPSPRVAQRLGCRDHIERHWQRAPLVYVVQPEFSPRELPFHVAVLLHVQPVKYQLVISCASFNEKYTQE